VLEANDMKPKEWAEKRGKNNKMENGDVQDRKQPRLEILFEIAKTLEVDPKELIESTKK
jgi:putative transcriptional regulator